jgi:hypothetical protein
MVLWLASSGAAAAQARSLTEGLRLNLHAGAAVLGGDAWSIRPGVSASYGNSRWFHVFVTYDRVPMRGAGLDFELRHLDVGTRVHVRGPGATLVPFGLVAYTWRETDYGRIPFNNDTLDVNVHGGGLSFGGGAAYHVRRRLALEGSLTWSGADMEQVTADGYVFRQDDAAIRDASWRLNVGVSWWIPRRR